MRRLIVFSDPGGAKPCLSLAKKWQESDEVLVCSDRDYAFFEMFGVLVRHCTGADAPSILDDFQPQSLYTGTSYTSKIEIDFLQAAKYRSIPTTSIVDHYTGFRERFESNEGVIFPDQIDVLDERARDLAIEAGLPANSLQVTGNPYHEFLRKWRSHLTKEQVFEQLGIPVSYAKTILFAPDPLSNAGGEEKFGTDEVGILGLLLEALGETLKPILLLIKAHPNQSIDYLKTGLKILPKNVHVHLVPSGNDAILNDLIKQVDVVVGMFSSILIESAILETNTLAILCGIKNSYWYLNRSLTINVIQRKQLFQEIHLLIK
jgi:hypothetical protein